MTILKVTHLSMAFGGLQATNDVNYEMQTGELSGIIGPNGAGKSTFFNLLSGYHRADSGRIFFKGKDITNWPPHRISRSGIARAFQVSSIYPALTTYENVRQAILARQNQTLRFFTPARRLAKKETRALLEVTGLCDYADRTAGTLSQGEKSVWNWPSLWGTNPSCSFWTSRRPECPARKPMRP
jgi:branched-chain amino acid transport system ATP-binding protein